MDFTGKAMRGYVFVRAAKRGVGHRFEALGGALR
jgi:hypothetical protein